MKISAANESRILRDSSNALSVLNDLFAFLFISIGYNYSEYRIIYWPIMSLFFMLTFINAYINKRKLNVFCVWAIIFWAYCILTGLWTDYPDSYSQLAIVMVRIMLTLCFTVTYANTERTVNIVLYGLLAGSLILAARLLIYTPAEAWGTARLGRAIGENENSVGNLLLWGSTISLYFSHKNRLLLILFLFLAILSFLTGSKKVFFNFVLVIFVFFIDKIDKPERLLYLVPLALAIFAIYYASFNNVFLYNVLGNRLEAFFQVLQDPDSANASGSTYIRMDLINIGIDVFLEKPLVGHGLGSFRNLNKYYTYAHNNYVELLACTGIIGTALYYFMPVFLFVKTMIIRMKKDKRITIFLLFMLIHLTQDIGAVRFHSEIVAITMAITYSMAIICSAKQTPSTAS